MLPAFTREKECECCHAMYVGTKFDTDTCVPCRRVIALERIAEVLEHWVGMQ